MAGECMGTDDYTELSAICTHPDFLGRGHARQLLIYLSNDNHARGRIPFLHVSHENPRAIGLYKRNGYRVRRDIPFGSLRQRGDRAMSRCDMGQSDRRGGFGTAQ